MTNGPRSRKDALLRLLAFEHPIEELVAPLTALPWDCTEQEVELEPRHVVHVLTRYRERALTASDVEAWANAIESRDDIGLASAHQDVLRRVVFELANPLLHGALTAQSASQWIAELEK